MPYYCHKVPLIALAKGESTVYVVDSNNKIQVRPVTVQGTHQGQWIVTAV